MEKRTRLVRKLIWLFVLTCGVSGLLTVLGSIGGHAFGRTGLFIGAVAGGIIGIALAGLIARGLRLVDHRSYAPIVIGGTIGFMAIAGFVVTVPSLLICL